MTCSPYAASRRRLFWATQPAACGETSECGIACGVPGLVHTNGLYACGSECDITHQPGCPRPVLQRSILTGGWVRGLIINMLMTDGKLPDTNCGFKPGTQGGHWSESYIEGGPAVIGTLARAIQPSGTMNESIALIAAYVDATLQRLVQRGVAKSVTVTSRYLGNAKLSIDVIVVGTDDTSSKVGLLGSRLQNSWVWE